MLIAQQLESEGSLREAEKHYTDAKDWKAAVQMYRSQIMWDDALRVAKVYGGVNATKQVAYAWAISLGGEEGAVLLRKLGLLEQVCVGGSGEEGSRATGEGRWQEGQVIRADREMRV